MQICMSIFAYLGGSFVEWDLTWPANIGTYKSNDRELMMFIWSIFTFINIMFWNITA